MGVIAANEILADFGLRLCPLCLDFIAAEGGKLPFLYHKLGLDPVPVEHILLDNNPETA